MFETGMLLRHDRFTFLPVDHLSTNIEFKAVIIVLISGWTPLHEAVLGHNYTIAETLLRAGALVNSVGHEGITPLQDAVQLGNFKV